MSLFDITQWMKCHNTHGLWGTLQLSEHTVHKNFTKQCLAFCEYRVEIKHTFKTFLKILFIDRGTFNNTYQNLCFTLLRMSSLKMF